MKKCRQNKGRTAISLTFRVAFLEDCVLDEGRGADGEGGCNVACPCRAPKEKFMYLNILRNGKRLEPSEVGLQR